MKYIFIFISILVTNTALANVDPDDLTPKEQACYAKAMVGFDSVINSRLGITPEESVRIYGFGTEQNDFYLQAVLGAYLWKETPHKYAVRTFLQCLRTINEITFIK